MIKNHYISNLTCLLVLLLAISLGCKKEDDDISIDPCLENPSDCGDHNPNELLDVVWMYPVYAEDTSSGSNYNLEMSKQGVVSNISGIQSKKLMLSDFNNGSQIFEWTGLQSSHFSTMSVHQEMDLAIVQYFANIASVNLNTGQLHKQYVLPSGSSANAHGQLIGDHYYFTRTNPSKTLAWLVRSHLNDFSNWETVYTIHTNDVGGSRPNIQSYNLWTDPQTGDEILVFQHRMAFPNRVDVVAYNMTKEEVIWQHDDLTALGNSNHQQIFILDDKAYFSGGTAFYCFDIPTGEILWQFDHPSGINGFGFYKTTYAESANLIIVKDAADRLYAFHPLYGNIVWVTSEVGDSGNTTGSPSYHDGIIYIANSQLKAFRAINGQMLWDERPPSITTTYFRGDVAIDPDRGVLYASDRRYLMAIKLYED